MIALLFLHVNITLVAQVSVVRILVHAHAAICFFAAENAARTVNFGAVSVKVWQSLVEDVANLIRDPSF